MRYIILCSFTLLAVILNSHITKFNRSAMYFLLCFIYLSMSHILAAEEDKSSCVTPHGEAGKCVLITSCPPLLDAFANPTNGNEEYLIQFQCTNEEEFENTYYYMQDIFVCCGVSSNFTVSDNATEISTANLTKLSDKRYCGLQHKDDFESTDDGIGINEFPWVASVLGKLLDEENSSLCSGALINSRYVLTSAYCVVSLPFWPYRQLYVRLGDYHKKNATDCVNLPQFDTEECTTHEDYRVELISPHPFYNSKTGMNNILLLRLAKTVTYSDYIRPICLPIPGLTFAKPNDTVDVSAVGSQWDIIGLTTMKLKTNTSIITNEKCEEALAKYHIVAHSNLICTTNFFNNSSPIEYEGAPLMFSSKHQWHIEGIMIRREFCSISSACLYTKVSQYLRWIQGKMRL